MSSTYLRYVIGSSDLMYSGSFIALLMCAKKHKGPSFVPRETSALQLNITKAHNYKRSKYEDIVSDIKNKEYKCNLFCLEVGFREVFSKDNEKRLHNILKLCKLI